METDTTEKPKGLTMETLVSLCKRRGFIYHASEIYGGWNGFYDYGPLGVELRRNLKQAWWQDMVHRRDDIVGLDSAIIQHPKVWEASGHVGCFSDPMVDCKESKRRFRADHLFFAPVTLNGEHAGFVSLLENPQMEEEAHESAKKLQKSLNKMGAKLEVGSLRPYTEATEAEYAKIPSPATGTPGSLTAPRDFNLMFQTHVGALSDASSVAYLRPETAQGIFTNFKNVLDSSRVKVPFGIAQIGKAFRNEITPRNYIFRSREFEQMEIEYFIPADDSLWQKYHEEWIQIRWDWLVGIGLKPELLGKDVHHADALAHYAQAAVDITFRFPFGQQELEGIAARGNYDLTQHQTASGKTLEYFDEITKERYLPYVIEPSLGVDRLLLAVLCSSYREDIVQEEPRTYLAFKPRVAPYKAAVLPLVKNKPEIVETAQNIYKDLQRIAPIFWDTAGAIGRRYRRMDEIGTPFCITIDFETLNDGMVTVRDRDTTQQTRISADKLKSYLAEQIF